MRSVELNWIIHTTSGSYEINTLYPFPFSFFFSLFLKVVGSFVLDIYIYNILCIYWNIYDVYIGPKLRHKTNTWDFALFLGH